MDFKKLRKPYSSYLSLFIIKKQRERDSLSFVCVAGTDDLVYNELGKFYKEIKKILPKIGIFPH